MRRAGVVVLALGLAFSTGCGGGDSSTLGKAEKQMADLKAGNLSMELSATTADVAKPVGFKVEGAFSFDGKTDLPIFDFDYTQLLGDDQQVTRIASDGAVVIVDANGTVQQLGSAAASSLRMGGGSGGFADLGIASWVESPKEVRRGDGSVITGRVNTSDLLSDLARIVAQVAGEGDVKPLGSAAADEVSRSVTSSNIEVVTDGDGLPSSIDATIDFGRDVPPKLIDALGPYAAATLHLKVELSRLDHELTVRLPR